MMLPFLALLACSKDNLPPETPREDRIVIDEPETGGNEDPGPAVPGEDVNRVALCVDLQCEREHMAYPWKAASDSKASAWYGFPVKLRLSLVSWADGEVPDTSTVLYPFNLVGARLNADVHIRMEPLEGHRFYGASRDAVKNSLDGDAWKGMMKEFARARASFIADGEPICDYDYSSTKWISEEADRVYRYCHFWKDWGREHPADTVLWESGDLFVGSLCDAFLPLESYGGDVFLKEVDEASGASLTHFDPVLTELLDDLQKADDRISRLRVYKWKLFGNNFGWGDTDGGTEWSSFGISLQNVSLSGAEGYELTHVIYRFRADGTPYWWKPVDGDRWAVPVDEL